MKQLTIKILNQKGMSLIEVVITSSILAIVCLALATLTANQTRQNRQLSEKIGTDDVSRMVTAILADNTKCSALLAHSNMLNAADLPFNGTTVSTTNPKFYTLRAVPGTSLQLGAAATSIAPTLFIKNWTSTTVPSGLEVEIDSPTRAKLHVRFDESKVVVALRELVFDAIPIVTSGAPTRLDVTGCGVAPAGALTEFSTPVACRPSFGSIGHTTTATCPAGKIVDSCGIKLTASSGNSDSVACSLDIAGNRCLADRDQNSGCDSGISVICYCR